MQRQRRRGGDRQGGGAKRTREGEIEGIVPEEFEHDIDPTVLPKGWPEIILAHEHHTYDEINQEGAHSLRERFVVLLICHKDAS